MWTRHIGYAIMFTGCITVNCARLFIADPYALDLTNNQFQSIDLSSLEEIRGDGLRYAVNQQLCYVGDLLSYLADPSNQMQCLTRERRPPNECSKWTTCAVTYTIIRHCYNLDAFCSLHLSLSMLYNSYTPHPADDAGLVCHVQCNSTFNCWGPMDHQCDSCANYQYKNRYIRNVLVFNHYRYNYTYVTLCALSKFLFTVIMQMCE